MKIRMIVGLGLVSISVVGTYFDFSIEAYAGPTVKRERAVPFLSSGDTPTVVASGFRTADAKNEKLIKVTPVDGGETITIRALVSIHEEPLTATGALIVAQEDLFHLSMPMPGRKTLDAVGSFGGVSMKSPISMIPLRPQQLRAITLGPAPLAAPALAQVPELPLRLPVPRELRDSPQGPGNNILQTEIHLRATITEHNVRSAESTKELARNFRGPVAVELDRTNGVVETFLAVAGPSEAVRDIELDAAKAFVAVLEAHPTDLSSPGKVMLELSPKEAEWSGALLTAGVLALSRTGRTDEKLFDALISVALGGAGRDDLLTRFVLTGGKGIDDAERLRLDDDQILDRLDDLLGRHPVTELVRAECWAELRAAAVGLAGAASSPRPAKIPSIAPVTGIYPNHGRPGATVILIGAGWPAVQPTDVQLVFTSNRGTTDLRATDCLWNISRESLSSQMTCTVPSGVGVGPVGFVSLPTETGGDPAASTAMADAIGNCLGARGSASVIARHLANWSPSEALTIWPGLEPGGVNLFTGGPQITSVQPVEVHVGDAVTITGHEFAEGDLVSFDGMSQHPTVASEVSLTVVVPAARGGKRTVQVHTPSPANHHSNSGGVQILPTFTSLSRPQARNGESVDAYGSGFNDGTVVTLTDLPFPGVAYREMITRLKDSQTLEFDVQLDNVPVGGDTVNVWIKNPPQSSLGPLPLSVLPPLLSGWVDLHTHPMSHLGFGKKLLHGAPDGSIGPDGKSTGSIIPAGTRDCNPTDLRASSINDALGNCNSTHGGWGLSNSCGDHVRAGVISSLLDKDFAHRVSGNVHGDHRHEGIETSPNFLYWPHQTSKAHQQMWWEWIKRAYKEGHLRVMVALAVNSELLAEIVNGDAPKDDKTSADLQIDELKSFVGRHNDFMEIAYSSADLRRIVGANKLAVILGMEVDNIGNFNAEAVNETIVRNEIQRLYANGVRYVFPIHLVDNKFGGTAVYKDLFNFANKYSMGRLYEVETSPFIDYKLGILPGPGVANDYSAIQAVTAALDAMSGLQYPPAFNGDPTSSGFCPVPIVACWRTFQIVRGIFTPDPGYLTYDVISGGHVNKYGLTDMGKFAVKEMMNLGMLIDIDHMSEKAINDTLDIAENIDGGLRPGYGSYPVNMGHNGIRGLKSSERHASVETVKRIAALGGVFGVGTADSDEHNIDAQTFISGFNSVWSAMGNSAAIAIGTDVNGMERLPRASAGLNTTDFYNGFPKATTGTREWDYTTEGVAHYGLMADFIKDVKDKSKTVFDKLMESSENFAKMWERVEANRSNLP